MKFSPFHYSLWFLHEVDGMIHLDEKSDDLRLRNDSHAIILEFFGREVVLSRQDTAFGGGHFSKSLHVPN